MSKSENIAVIGAGLMGHGIAQIFAVHGHPVFLMDLEDTLLSNAIDSIRANLSLMAEKGIGSEAGIEPAIQRIRTTTDLTEAASQAKFVVEAVLEKLDLKHYADEYFKPLARKLQSVHYGNRQQQLITGILLVIIKFTKNPVLLRFR